MRQKQKVPPGGEGLRDARQRPSRLHRDELRLDGARNHGPRVDGPRVDGPRVDGPRVDGPRVDGPRVDGPRVDGPRRSATSRSSRVVFSSVSPDDDAWERRIAVCRERVIAAEKAVLRAEADRAAALAELQEAEIQRCESDAELDHALRSRAAECAAALHLNDRKVLGDMADAHRLVTEFPETFAALSKAEISGQHARAIVHECIGVAPAKIPEYENRCLQVAAETTPARLRVSARRIAEGLHMFQIDERHRISSTERRVWVRDLPDGMAELGAVLPAVLAYGIKDRLNRAARSMQIALDGDAKSGQDPRPSQCSEPVRSTRPPRDTKPARVTKSSQGTTSTQRTESDLRAAPVQQAESAQHAESVQPAASARQTERARIRQSLDNLRADLLADLLLTGTSAAEDDLNTAHRPDNVCARRASFLGVTANIQLVVPADGSTAALRGYGPIDAATARQFAAIAPGWDRIAIDPGGALLATDRRQPSEAMRRILEARDQHCRFPGCHIPAGSCEIDHTREWGRGGRTAISNLGHLCPRHHRLKHPDLAERVRWRAQQDRHGTYTWTSPSDETYTENAAHPFDSAETQYA